MSNPFYNNVGIPFNNAGNPFLIGFEDEQQLQPAADLTVQGYVNRRNIKLPEFWPNIPVLWFSRAEFNFKVAGVVESRQKFIYVTNALPYDALTLVSDLVFVPPQEDPYRALKERLLISHKLTTVQMAEKVLDLPALGDRRPSQLLAAMLEFCPAGEADTAFFRASFFRRLPKEIRVLLADEVNGNLKELAIRADELYTHHRSTAVAAIHQGDMWEDTASLEEAVAALNIKGGRDSFGQSDRRSPATTRQLVEALLPAVVAAATAAAAARTTSSATATGNMGRRHTSVTCPRSASGRETS